MTWNEQEEQNGIHNCNLLYFVVLRYFELESTGQEVWSDFAAALNQYANNAAKEESKEEDSSQMAEYMAITFQETFADPLGLNHKLIFEGINDEFYRKGGAVSSALQITNRQFSAEEILRIVHPDTSFGELQRCLPLLEQKIKEKREAQRDLVKQNFERFVGAKATIDTVFLEMQSQGLTTGDYGLGKCRDAVVQASNKVKELYAPLLEDQRRESELRRKLAWVNRHRWLLEAPLKLQEFRQIGDFAGFVKGATELVQQWKAYVERESPMLEKLSGFWQLCVFSLIREVLGELRDRLATYFSSASDAQQVMSHYDSLATLLEQKESALDIYLKVHNERLIVEINKIFSIA